MVYKISNKIPVFTIKILNFLNIVNRFIKQLDNQTIQLFQTVDKVPGIRSGFFYEKSLEIQHLWGLSGSFLV